MLLFQVCSPSTAHPGSAVGTEVLASPLLPSPPEQEALPAVSDTQGGWDDSSQTHQQGAGLIFQGKGSVFHPGAKLFLCPSGSQVTGTARRGRTPCPASRELSGFI